MDLAAKKNALRRVPYGLYVGGCHQAGMSHAFLLSWFSQCSFKPPLVMAAVKHGSKAHDLILKGGVFSVNLLDETQKPLAGDFLRHAVLENGKLNGHAFKPGVTKCPILEEAAAWLECKVLHALPEPGDHTVVVAEVVEAGTRRPGRSLDHNDTGWEYGG